MTARRRLMWLLAATAVVLWLALVLAWSPPASSPACLAGLDTLEALPSTPSAAFVDEVEVACGH